MDAIDEEDLQQWDDGMLPYVDLVNDHEMFEKYELETITGSIIRSCEGDTWRTIIKQFDPPLPPEFIEPYRKWLVEESPYSQKWEYDLIPTARGARLQPDLEFVQPFGHNWEVMLQEEKDKQYGSSSKEVQKLLRASLAEVVRYIRLAKDKCIGKVMTRKTRVKTIEAGLKACPRNLREALQGEDSAEWQQAADLVFDTLTQMVVIDHGFTFDEVIAAGISKKPI
jgi:hypothetical protein